uniref:Uncharacterized protein n=1 Tax=Picea glauca TaxID=3330 RepID=A0A101M407_PICGL|nr:hypothetical protein ABT39_MTgene533 [Picea glauca]QHR89410.1 hypothetical protein Q903MT_gene3431 [Picea sitchensis]
MHDEYLGHSMPNPARVGPETRILYLFDPNPRNRETRDGLYSPSGWSFKRLGYARLRRGIPQLRWFEQTKNHYSLARPKAS